MSQLEDENRNLRIRLADTSSAAADLIDQTSHQDSANTMEGGQGHGAFSAVSNAAIPQPADKGTVRRGIAEDYGRPTENTSTNLNSTSTSVLEDTSRISKYSSPFSGPLGTDSGGLEKRLEAEAATQREFPRRLAQASLRQRTHRCVTVRPTGSIELLLAKAGF